MSSAKRLGKITNLQLFSLVVNNMFATGVYSIARTTAEVAGRAFAVAIAQATVFSLLQLLAMYLLAKRFPEQTISELAATVLGKPLAALYLIGYAALTLSLAVIVPRNFWLVASAWSYHNTPRYALLVPFALICWNIARRGLIVLSRISEMLLWLSVPIMLFLILPHGTFDLDQLRPVFDKGVLAAVKGVLPAYFSMIGFDVLLFVYPFTDRKRTLPVAASGVIAVGLIYIIVSIMVIGTTGLEMTLLSTWPLQQYLNHFSLGLVERIDIVILFGWVLQVIMTSTISLYAAAACLRGVFPRLTSRTASSLLLPFTIVAAIVPVRLPQQIRLQNVYSLIALFYVGFLPAVLWLASIWRKKGGGRSEGDK